MLSFNLKIIVNKQMTEDVTVTNCFDCPLGGDESSCTYWSLKLSKHDKAKTIHKDCGFLKIKKPKKMNLIQVEVSPMSSL